MISSRSAEKNSKVKKCSNVQDSSSGLLACEARTLTTRPSGATLAGKVDLSYDYRKFRRRKLRSIKRRILSKLLGIV